MGLQFNWGLLSIANYYLDLTPQNCGSQIIIQIVETWWHRVNLCTATFERHLVAVTSDVSI